jgi:nucleotide-binding universal stress UspA family protein
MQKLAISKILVALGDSPVESGPLPAAVDLVQRMPNAELLLFHARGPIALEWKQLAERLRTASIERLEAHTRHVPEHVPVSVVSRIGAPWRAICRAASEQRADLVVVGAHALSGIDGLLRTTAERVARTSDVPVLTVPHKHALGPRRHGLELGFGRILVPVDFSPESGVALEYATRLASRIGGSVRVLHAWRPPGWFGLGLGGLAAGSPAGRISLRDLWRTRAEAQLREIPWAARPRVEQEIGEGDPSAVILAAAAACDLVVLGPHVHPSVSGVLRRRVASRLVRGAPCPVLTLSRPGPNGAGATAAPPL